MWKTAAFAAAAFAGMAAAIACRRRRRNSTTPLRTTGMHAQTRKLGGSSLHVTVLGQGCASLGDLYVKLDDVSALTALKTAHDAGITFFDSSPWYGVGLSEARVGLALHHLPRDSLVVQTKVGRYLIPDPACVNGTKLGWIGGYHMSTRFDYSGEAFERQLQDSLQRTGLGRIESLVIHDLEPTPHQDPATGKDGMAEAHQHLATLVQSGFAALQHMRGSGVIQAFGAGVNSDEGGEDPAKKKEWNRHYVRTLLGMAKQGEHGIDFLLCANMHSLLNHDAHELGILDDCAAAGVGVVVGGPYSSGILATGPDPVDGSTPFYNYEPATEEVRARARRIEAVCQRHGVPLIAAALQYPLRHRAVCSVIPGGKSVKEVVGNVELMNVAIPEGLWKDLEGSGLVPKFF